MLAVRDGAPVKPKRAARKSKRAASKTKRATGNPEDEDHGNPSGQGSQQEGRNKNDPGLDQS